MVELLVERACVWDAAGLATLAGPCGRTGADHWALGLLSGSSRVRRAASSRGARPRAAKWRAVVSRGEPWRAVAPPGWRFERAGVLTTDLRASRPLLMKMASCRRSPDAPERLTFSEPPRSARQSCETTIGAAVSCSPGAVTAPPPPLLLLLLLTRLCCCCCVTVSSSSEWAREERSFIIVAARRLLASALASSPSAFGRIRVRVKG